MDFEYPVLCMRNDKNKLSVRYRFDSKGEVIVDRRRFTSIFDTDAYKSGDPIFAPKRCSPARYKFRAK